MGRKQSFADDVGQNFGHKEDATSDGIVRWDGNRLFVKEIVHRGGVKTDTRERDITAEVAAALRAEKDHA